MCYTRKEQRDLEREARRITESRLMEEEARHRHEDHHRRRRREQEEENKPLTEKDKEWLASSRQTTRIMSCAPGVLRLGVSSCPLFTLVRVREILRTSP